MLEAGRLAANDAAARRFLFEALADPGIAPSAAAALAALGDPGVSAEIGRRLVARATDGERRCCVLALQPRPGSPAARAELERFARAGAGFAATSGEDAPVARAMSRAVLAALLFGAALPAAADCIFDSDGEITNPFAPGCGDVLFTYTDDDNSGTNIALGYPPPVPVASMTPVAGFREYASLFAQHQSLLALNDEVDGEVVGETLAGREIWAYVIGDADATTAEGFAEAAVLVNGGIHAREWQTPEAVTALFEALVAGKADGGFVQYLVENLNTVLVPVNNVDGFIQTQLYPVNVTADREQPREGRMRRKNLRNPQTERLHRLRHRHGRGQLLGRGPQPQRGARLRPAGREHIAR